MFWSKKAEMPPQSIKSNEDVVEQLYLLKDLTKRTGILHEVQRMQLDYWIRIVLDKAIDHTLMLELLGESRSVTFDVKTKGRQKDIEIRLKPLTEWVKWLLGDDLTVKVRIGGELVWQEGPTKI